MQRCCVSDKNTAMWPTDKKKSRGFRASASRISQGSQQVACDAGIQSIQQFGLLPHRHSIFHSFDYSAYIQLFNCGERFGNTRLRLGTSPRRLLFQQITLRTSIRFGKPSDIVLIDCIWLIWIRIWSPISLRRRQPFMTYFG